MKKYRFCMIFVLALSVLAVGCGGGGGEEAAAPEAAAAPEPTAASISRRTC